jgi:hypothetical protein
VKIVEQLRSWRIAGAMRACFTVELPAGSLSRSDVSPGDRLTLQPANASSVQ